MNRLIGVLIVCVVLALVMGVKSSQQIPPAQVKLHHDEASLVSSALDYYYVKNNQYPVHMSDLYQTTGASTKSAAADLKDLNYTVTGDGQSYKFSYFDGQHTQTAAGNYSKDYHGE